MWLSRQLKSSFCLLCLLPLSLFGQKQAAIWYFGDHAGLDFNNCEPVALIDGMLDQKEGCASIADSYGNILFYTDGMVIYNANHQLMQNGTGLLGDPSSAQSAIVIPDPGDSTKFYVFTVDAFGQPDGLNYSMVDMTLDGGLGGVVLGQKNIQLATPVAEKLTATYHANGKDIWVITHEMGNNHFLSYLVTASGVTPNPVISSVGKTHINHPFLDGEGAIGCIKISPDGKKLACGIAYVNTGLELFDFNNTTGVVSNPQLLAAYKAYGVEFSPNSDLLYVTSPYKHIHDLAKLYQFNISLPNSQSIRDSETLIATDSIQQWGSLQLGIDGKIYMAQAGLKVKFLNVINNPNRIGSACNFSDDAVYLAGKNSLFGLPQFITSYFKYEITYSGDPCSGDAIQFQVESFGAPENGTTWDFGDPGSPQNSAVGNTVFHVFSSPGTYTVTASIPIATNCNGSNTINLTKEVTIYPDPELNQPENIVQCDIEVFDLTQILPEMLSTNQNAEDFTITYYKSQPDADAGTPGTEIANPEAYSIKTTPQQTIHVRVENEYGCYDTVSFQIMTNPKPVVDLSAYDGMAICVDLDPTTPVIGGNYSPILIETGLSETKYIFQWSLDGNLLSETGSSVLANVPGEYTVTVTDITSTDPSCVATSSATILQSNPPEFDVKPVFFEGKTIISNVVGNGDYEFSTDQISWTDLGENTSLSLQTEKAGLVKVYGHDKNGCGTTVIEVWMIDYMKFFTPNQDGINDRWKILGLQEQSEANVYIFDRYGKLLASLNPSGPGWNGFYNGKPMPANDYWFRLEYKSPDGTPKVLQENFTLMR